MNVAAADDNSLGAAKAREYGRLVRLCLRLTGRSRPRKPGAAESGCMS
jgi:hypothetical protein